MGEAPLRHRVRKRAARTARRVARAYDRAWRRVGKHLRQDPAWSVLVLFILAKVVSLWIAYELLGRPSDFLPRLSTEWDGKHYLQVARDGYPDHTETRDLSLLAFPPLFPFLIGLIGAPDIGPFAVSNACSLVAVMAVTRLMGWRNGLLFALFPTWLGVSSWGYTESTFVLVAALAFLAWRARRLDVAGALTGLAVATRYGGAAPFLVFGPAALRHGWRGFLRFSWPVAVAGIAFALFFRDRTGELLGYRHVDDSWGVEFAMPWTQYDWYLHGWFTNQPAVIDNVHPSFWLLRNYAFVVLSIMGAWHLWARRRERLWAAYSGMAIILTITVIGAPAIATPRLLLLGFPAVAALGDYVRGRGAWLAVGALGVLGAAWFHTSHLTGYFS